jgi:hypothetical protein
LPQHGSSGGINSSITAVTALQPLPQLQQLHLAVPLTSTKAMLQFTQCVSVTQLKLEGLGFRDCPVNADPPDQTRKVSALLSRLTQLQALSVKHLTLNDTALTAISSSSLTALSLDKTVQNNPRDGWYKNVAIPTHPMPPQLAQLRVLHVTRDEFNASVLACMQQLQEIVLDSAWLTSGTNGVVDNDERSAANVQPEAVLMTALAKLQHLRHLDVHPTVETPRRHDPMLYTALTASSHLTYLNVGYYEAGPWEAGMTRHVFPDNRQWQHLQELHLYVGTSK